MCDLRAYTTWTIVMKDYLVYIVAGYHPYFSKLVELCIQSIRDNNDMSLIDICVMCDQKYTQLFQHLSDIMIHITDDNPSPVMASMRKLEVFNIPNIMSYKRVLFLDGDILVCGNLIENIFLHAGVHDPSTLYTFEEDYPNPHRAPWFSLGGPPYKYSEEQIQELDRQGKRGINAGQFMFIPSEEMKAHFANMIQMIKSYQGPYHYEQSFMNVYLRTRGKCDSTVLQPHVRIYPDFTRYEPGKTIVHFNGDGVQGPFVKWRKMQHYYGLHKLEIGT